MKKPIFVVGVGASAGGLEALTELFANLPTNLAEDFCFVVAQHLSPNYKSMLVQILAKEAVLPVIEAEHNQPLQSGNIYITPPDSDIQIINNIIQLSKPSLRQIPKPSVDILLSSLAQEYGSHSIAIILSGTGSDGAIGVQEVKSKGGYVFIQNPKTAKYDGMPFSALQTGLVDYSLPVSKIGEKIQEICIDKIPIIAAEETPTTEPDIEKLFALLNKKFGVNFNLYKNSTLFRRIDKAMQRLKIQNLDEYVAYVSQHPDELHTLYDSFLINITHFFRDAESYQVLTQEIEKKIQNLDTEDNFRIWVVGCATGEEAYSLAMLVEDLIEKSQKKCNLQIFATDIDEKALNFARKAEYPLEQIQYIPEEFAQKYTIRTNAGFEIEKNIRAKVLFSKHDFTQNPPFLKIDVLSCRNLLIYLTQESQRHILPIFHYALKTDGILFLGKSESITQTEDLFEVINTKHKVFKKKHFHLTPRQIKINTFKPLNLNTEDIQRNRREEAARRQMNFRNRLAETFMNITELPYLVVNPLMEVVEVKGEWVNFMQIPEGVMSFNINKILRPEILLDTKNLILRTIKEKQNQSTPLKKILIQDKKIYLKLRCGLIGIDSRMQNEELYLLVLEQYDLEEDIARFNPNISATDDPTYSLRVQELEEELQVTKEHLQTYIEEIETANEELQSTNEELQSLNEELQSSNEELETSNEELQSSNEELQSAYIEIKFVNTELGRKQQALSETNLLLATLFDNVQQGNILLNDQLIVKIISQKAKSLLAVTDMQEVAVGQKLDYVLPTSLRNTLFQLIEKTQKVVNFAQETIEITTKDKVLYYDLQLTRLQELAFTQNTHFVLSIIDLTALKENEKAIFQRDAMLASLINSNTSYLVRTDMEGNYTYVNDAFCQKFGFKPELLLGQSFMPTLHPDDIEKCINCIYQLVQKPNEIISVELRKPNPKGGFFYTQWEFVAIQDSKGNITEIQCVGTDTTAYKLTLQQLEQERNQLELMIWGGRLGTWDWNLTKNDIIFNERWAEILGYDLAEVNHLTIEQWQELIHPEDRQKVLKSIQDNIAGSTAYHEIEHRKKAKNGEWKWLLLVGKVVERDSKGKARRIIGIHQDITDRKKAEQQVIISEARNKSVLDTMQEGIVIQDMEGNIISCNHSAETILGLSYQQMIGRNSIDPRWRSVHEDGSPFPGEEHPAMQTIRTQKPQSNVIMGVHKPNGELTWVSINSQLLYNPDTQEPYAVFTVFHDITQRKNAEDALATEQRRVRDILKGTNVGTWEWNIQTGEMIVNERWAEIIGYELADLEPIKLATWLTIIHPEDLDKFDNSIQRHLKGETAYYECETRIKHKEGHWVWVLDRGKIHTWDKDDKPLLMSGTHQDITQRKQMEEEIRDSERYLKYLLNSLPIAVYTTDTEGNTIFMNMVAEKILIPNIIENKHWCNKWQFYDTQLNPIAEENCPAQKAIMLGSTTQTEDVLLQQPTGKITYLLAQATPLFDAQNQVKGAICVLVDISEIKEKEQVIRNISQEYERVFQSTQDAMFLAKLNKNGQFTYLRNNKKHQELTGINETDLQGKTPIELVGEQLGNTIAQNYQSCIDARQAIHYEEKIDLPSGTHYWHTTLTPVFLEDGTIYIVGSSTNITEQREAEEKVQRNEYMLNLIVNNFPEGSVSLIDIETLTFLYTGGKGYQKTNKKPQHIIGKHITEVLTKEIHQKIIEVIPQLKAKQEVQFEVKYKARTFVNSLAPISSETEDQVHSFVLVAADITERKHLETELYKLSLVAQRTSNSVIITDSKRRIIWVNEGFTRVTGYTLNEVFAKSPKMFQFEETNPETLAMVSQKLAQQEPVRFEIYNKGKYNTYWLDVEIQPLFDNQDNLTGFMAVQSDITERKKAEDKVQKQNAILREIAFFHSHILRRPIANIIGLMYLLEQERKQSELSLNSNITLYLDLLNKAVKETDEIIAQIVSLSDEIE